MSTRALFLEKKDSTPYFQNFGEENFYMKTHSWVQLVELSVLEKKKTSFINHQRFKLIGNSEITYLVIDELCRFSRLKIYYLSGHKLALIWKASFLKFWKLRVKSKLRNTARVTIIQ